MDGSLIHVLANPSGFPGLGTTDGPGPGVVWLLMALCLAIPLVNDQLIRRHLEQRPIGIPLTILVSLLAVILVIAMVIGVGDTSFGLDHEGIAVSMDARPSS